MARTDRLVKHEKGLSHNWQHNCTYMIIMPFMFEKLEVYQRSKQFVVEIYSICRDIQHKEIKDQIKRAVLSIPLNIAEGNGRYHTKERKQYFYTARGSLLECASILSIMMDIDPINRENYYNLYRMADEIGKMLNGLIRSIDSSKQ